ncbi:MAG: Asp-tRNA(Asn)/Glu-tRNA(Gln) amidotransferase subunit GatA [Kofleriaceae bacterium]|nr:Asp-tRNA(Asn)/Glu-tRNA(Gln) amidotransferase subunit GatA [Kofleriaceae bacterium]
MTVITQLSAAEQARKVRQGEISASELCQAYLKRIASQDEEIGAYLRVDEEGALAQAAKVDTKIAAGHPVGALAGVPVGLRDLLVTKDLETTAASKILEGWIPPYDAQVVSALRCADAVILGKLNMDEFAMGSSTENSAYKPCTNPWDRKKVPGGSSGGSAAAVASDLCSISLGTDTGGSIRQPAAFCGVLGLKPSYGRVSRYGVIAYASSLDQVGPITRTAEDAALVLEVISGHDPRDATSSQSAVPKFRDSCGQGVAGLRIGIADEMSLEAVDSQVRERVDAAIAELKAGGAEVKRVSLPHTKYALSAYYIIAPAEAASNLSRYDGVRFGMRLADDKSLQEMYEETRGQGFGTEVKRRIMLGTFALRAGYYDAYYKKAQQIRTLIARDFEQAFADVDVIASPTAPTTAFGLGEKTSPLEMYQADIFTLSCNLAGLPGMSLNCGFDDANLPVGLQLLAPRMQEESLLRCAGYYQSVTDWHAQRPG